MENKLQQRTLRVAFPAQAPASDYEPTSIRFGYEYIFLENVFSPLVEVMANGAIEPGVAEKIEWIDDELKLTIRDGLRTRSGIPITAQDVVFSLKRLLVLSGNTHGNFKDIVCPNSEIKSVDDPCPGIRAEGNIVFLRANGRKSFLIPMLGAIDFAIIPKGSVNPKSLKIENFAETSGPYWVESDDGQGKIKLRLNQNHYFAASDIPDEIFLVPTNTKIKGDSVKAFKDGLVDHLTTIDAAKSDELIGFANAQSDVVSHVTMKIRSLAVVFTERGRTELSPSERRYIGEKLRSVFSGIYKNVPGYEQRAEFFPSLGEGGLTPDQQRQLTEIRDLQQVRPAKKFKLGLIKRGPLEEWSRPIAEALPEADSYIENNVPDLQKGLKLGDMPHAFIASTDTGFMEDISLISYSLNAGLLGLAKSDRQRWLAEYMALDDKAERITKLKNLHFQALAEPAIVPLMASPYAAIVRKPWRIDLSELFANNQLWRIKLP